MAKLRSSCAVRFLWLVAGLTVLVVALAGLYRWFEQDLMRWIFIPSVEFREVPMPNGADYSQARLWIARPDIANNPALWTPEGLRPTATPRASVFFIHPTSFLESNAWNAPAGLWAGGASLPRG